MSFIPWVTITLGLVAVGLGLARILDAGFTKNMRWPGSFASGTPRQRAQLVALLPLGAGVVLLGIGQVAGPDHKTVAAIFLIVAALVFAVALIALLRASRIPG